MQDGPEAIEDWITPDGVEGLVSIVIPTCNRAAFLAETIDSVFEQEYRPIEIIVVDDDSTDDTQATVTRLQSQTPSGIELLYLHQAKAGGPAARNRGARRSTGEFIVFMDDDDLFSRRFLLSHIEAFALQPAANLSFGRWKRFKFVDSEYAILDHKGHFPPTANSPWEAFLLGWEILLQSCLLRRTLVSEVGPWVQHLMKSQDLDYKLRLLGHRCCVVDASTATIYYRLHTESITGQLDPAKVESYVEVFRYAEDIAVRRDDYEMLRQTFADFLWKHGFWLTSNGEHAGALRVLRQAQRHDATVCHRNGPLLARVLGRLGFEAWAGPFLHWLFRTKTQLFPKGPVKPVATATKLPPQ